MTTFRLELRPKLHRPITAIVQLREWLVVATIRLEHLANTDAVDIRTQEIREEPICPAGGAPVRQLPKFRPAVLTSWGRETAGLVRAAGSLHDHGAVARLSEKILVAGILEAATAFEISGWDGFGRAIVAVGELELPFGEVEVAARVATGVEGGGGEMEGCKDDWKCRVFHFSDEYRS